LTSHSLKASFVYASHEATLPLTNDIVFHTTQREKREFFPGTLEMMILKPLIRRPDAAIGEPALRYSRP
jgi:hypothetical protein